MDFVIDKIRGLRTRENEIYQDGYSAIDCDNVRLNGKRELVKIDAFSINYTLPSPIEIRDTYYIKSKDELFIVENDKFSRIINASKTDGSSLYEQITTYSISFVKYQIGTKLSFQEVNNNLYIADPSDFSFVQKYDGQIVSRAGVGKPTLVDTTGAGTNRYFRSYIGMKDANGLESSGDFFQSTFKEDGSGNFNFTVGINDSIQKLDRKIKGMLLLAGSVLINSAQLSTGSISLDSNEHNLVLGDSIFAWAQVAGSANSYPDEIKLVVSNIVVVGPTSTITFDIVYGGDINNLLALSIDGALSSCRLYFAYSDYSTYGYKLSNPASSSNIPINFMWYRDSYSNTISYVVNTFNFQGILEDYYDSTIVKGDMPKFRYLSAFQNQIVGVTGDFSIAWSDLGVGSSCETFGPFDTETFNKSDEGIITGIFCGDSYISIFKEQEIYHMQGILYSRAYRIVKDSSSGIGCSSNASITRFGGGCLFMSSRGIYLSDGQLSREVTDHIDDLMSFLAFFGQEVVSFADYNNERILFSNSAESYEYDYYHNEWFKQSLLNTGLDEGRYFSNKYNGNMMKLYSDRVEISSPSNIKSHSGFFESSFINCGDPYREKKFNSISIMSSSSKTFSISVDSFWNWTSSFNSSLTKKFTPLIFLHKFGIESKTANSFSFRINSKANEEFEINGFMIEYEPYQTKVRA